jgi:acyl-CoA synthetase (AMP-forming)/AMP-acid ligase II
VSLIEDVTTLAELPGIVSTSYGPKTALIVGDRKTTYQQFDRLTDRVANALRRHGIGPNDRIAIMTRDPLATIQLIFGAAKTKAVAVPINWRLAAAEVAHILDDARPRMFFVDEEFQPLLSRLVETALALPETVPISVDAAGNTSLEAWSDGEPDQAPAAHYGPEDVVVQIYTSGTTGHPKGVRLPNRSFFAIAQRMAAAGDPWIGWSSESVSLLFVPLFHIGGLWWLVRGLAVGSTNIVLRAFDAAAVLRAIPEYRVTKTCMVPAMAQVLLSEPGCERTDFSSLETIVYGGSPITTELLRRAMTVFGCDFCQIYGMTEAGNMAVCFRPDAHRQADDRRLRAAGTPLPGVEVNIVDRDRRPVGAGVVGEIAIKSPASMQGYWNEPVGTRELADGWIMTGDAGYKDEQGFIYICDRIKDMIISAGENIYSAEVENVIRRHPAVADVAVIGIPDRLWGEAVKAVVVLAPGCVIRPRDLIQHTRVHLAEFKVPKSIEFVEELPRNASGKVLKSRLREQVASL